MKKLFLLLFAVMSLNAMEDDNNNNNNNDDTNKALIIKKNTDWIPGASRVIVHQHHLEKKWGRNTYRRCWRHYPVACCAKIKANKCPDFGNPEVDQAYLVVAFYDLNKKIMTEHTITQQKSKDKKAKKNLFDMAKKQLDPNVKPQAVGGVLLTSFPPMSLQLYDKDGLQIFHWEGLICTQLPLKPQEKQEVSRWVDLTNMPDSALITDAQEYEAEQKAKKDLKLKKETK